MDVRLAIEVDPIRFPIIHHLVTVEVETDLSAKLPFDILITHKRSDRQTGGVRDIL
jgi:hypothetical protein